MSRAARGSRKPARGSSLAFRRGLILSCFLLSGTVIVAKAAQLQVVQHEQWLAAAEEQHRERVELPARRGAIYDREGVPLALSHELYQVSVAPSELRDREDAAAALAAGLGLTVAEAAEATDPERAWVVLPGRYSAEQRRKVGSLRGVYFERQLERFYPQGAAGREVIGAVTRDGRALGGIEQQMDEALRGEAGYSVLRRDARGQAQPTISLPVVPPKDGASVHLTIDFDLQEIADAALRNAIASTGATGGDMMLSDPQTGEILAAVSLRKGGRTRSLAAITEPYEPGSTLKPFLAATLLAEGQARMTDSVYGENGTWTEGRRTFRDTSPHQWLTLHDALRVSSNIALVKFAKRLSPGQQFAYLRDFGFGTATGIEYPAESSGRLRRPQEWSALSSGSLAMGYELSVTPLQLVSAYGALANGGTLMEPYLVREVRGADGETIFQRSPTAVRRVIPSEVAKAITEVLVSVVHDGTATRAGLATFEVAGKTGTSRLASRGGYASGAYISTFAGYFPAADPQIVVFVKLDEPQGAYYGGVTAAPVTREALESILAASTPGLDGETLLATRVELATTAPAAEEVDPMPVPQGSDGIYVFMIADPVPSAQAQTAVPVQVPDVRGLSAREAVRRLHRVGLRVSLEGSGPIRTSRPEAGGVVARDSIITLVGAAH